MNRKIYIINGNCFSNLEEFFEEVSSVLIPGITSCKSIDSFNDILRGEYGPLGREFTLVWKNSDLSRTLMGHDLTASWLRSGLQHLTQGLDFNRVLEREYTRIKHSFPNRDEAFHLSELRNFETAYYNLEYRLTLAQQHQGDTLFDIIVSLIREHSNVELKLE